MGTLRFYLAICVFIWHCWQTPDRHFLGSYAAVYCFFIMSGFYISMALTQTYTATRDGALRFYANRALRLFPIYLAALFLTAACYALGLYTYGIPGLNGFGPLALIDQMTVLPQAIWRNLTLNTSAESNTLAIGWYYTVGLEMIFYALAPFFVRWRLPNLLLLFVAAGGLHFVPYAMELPERQWQYEFFPSTIVFFVAGCLAYRLYLAIKDGANRYVGWLIIPSVAGFGYAFDQQTYTNHFEPICLYAGFTVMIPFLFIASSKSMIDKFLGDISYPFYVVHGLAAGLVGGGVGRETNVIEGLAMAIALSVALHLLVEMPLERYRTSIRARTCAIYTGPRVTIGLARLPPTQT